MVGVVFYENCLSPMAHALDVETKADIVDYVNVW
jgi:hypothetical protein